MHFLCYISVCPGVLNYHKYDHLPFFLFFSSTLFLFHLPLSGFAGGSNFVLAFCRRVSGDKGAWGFAGLPLFLFAVSTSFVFSFAEDPIESMFVGFSVAEDFLEAIVTDPIAMSLFVRPFGGTLHAIGDECNTMFCKLR